MKKILTILILSFLAGCSSIRIVRKDEFQLPPELFYDCKDIPHATGSSDSELLIQSKETFKNYSECRISNDQKKQVLLKLEKALK